MFNKFIGFLCVSLTLAMFNETIIVSNALKYSIYAILILLTLWLFGTSNKFGYNPLRNNVVLVLLFLLFLNFLLSPYEPNYSWLIKYIAYIFCFVFGELLYKQEVPMKVNKIILYTLAFLPVILVGLFDHTAHKNMFFVLSNTYSFTGLSISLLVFTLKLDDNRALYYAFGVLALYIVSCSSLGIVGAVVLAVLIINRYNAKLMFWSTIGGIFFVILVLFSDIEVFKRIRDVIMVFQSMSMDDWRHVRDLDLYYLTEGMSFESSRTDNTSLIWRVAQWLGILQGYFENWYFAIPFGLGDSYALRELGNYPHNDYIRILCEYGLIVFVIVMRWLKKVCKTMARDVSFYFICAYFIYFFTENIIDTFVANAIMFMCIGYNYTRCKNGDIRTLKI